jgi:TolA-binding protein
VTFPLDSAVAIRYIGSENSQGSSIRIFMGLELLSSIPSRVSPRIVPFLFVLLLGGCVVSDFVSQRYENSVAYFNTYYNASRIYDEAILEIESTEKSQRSKGLPPPKEISATAKQKLTTVIEKCSNLLLYHPKSKWVDDALMLIGRSYYYQGEYLKAERKFAELIAQFPDSKRFLEARLWLAKSFRRDNEYEKAIREFQQVSEAATIESEDEIAAVAFLGLAEVHLDRKSYDEALKSYQEIVDRVDSKEAKAEAQFHIGEIHEIKGEYATAAAAFKRVLDFKPDYSTAFASQFRYAVNENKAKNSDEALRVLYDLVQDKTNIDFHPLLKLEIAKVLQDKGEHRAAIEAYYILDTSYVKTDIAAKSYYQLGLIYEDVFGNYAAAETNYVRAQAEFAASEVVPLAQRRSENLRKYLGLHRILRGTDSMLVAEVEKLSKQPDTSETIEPGLILDSLSNQPLHEVTHQDTLVKKEEVADTSSSLAADTLAHASRKRPPKPWKFHFELWDSSAPNPMIHDLKRELASKAYELGVLFFLEMGRPDSAAFWCERAVGLSPDSELAARALYTLAEVHRSRSASKTVVDSLYQRIIAEYPGTQYGKEVARLLGIAVGKKEEVDPAATVYHDCETLLRQNRTPEAIAMLQKVLRDYPSSPYSAKSLYAIGWVYENLERRPDSARVYYGKLMRRFPSSRYAAAVGLKLAEVERIEAEEAARLDSVAAHTEAKAKISSDSTSVEGRHIVLPDSSLQKLEEPVAPIDQEVLPSTRPRPPFKKTRPDTTRVLKE